MNTTQKLQVGDRVIFRKGYREAPVETTVVRVTKSGQVYILSEISTERFKQEYGGSYASVGRHTLGSIWSWSQETWDRFQAEYAFAQEEKEQKRQQREAQVTTAKATKEREMSEVKEAMGADLVRWTLHSTLLPDGSRLKTLQLPVKPDLNERKGSFEIIVVRLIDVEDHDWENRRMVPKVQSCITSCHGGTKSWPSYGTELYNTDEEALWEACRRVYHNW